VFPGLNVVGGPAIIVQGQHQFEPCRQRDTSPTDLSTVPRGAIVLIPRKPILLAASVERNTWVWIDTEQSWRTNDGPMN